MPACAVLGCPSSYSRGLVYFKPFPKRDCELWQIWVKRIKRRGWRPSRYSAVCQHHFDDSQWEISKLNGKRKLKETAVPTIFRVPVSKSDRFKDHTYCIPGYRQIYDDADSGGTMPIEHIDLEPNKDCSLDLLSEETEDIGEPVKVPKKKRRKVEKIQCTPDIAAFPREDEDLEPIEVVKCGEEVLNHFTGDPGDDPLAISTEDMMKADGNVPLFNRSQKKFFFVPQDTKYEVSLNETVQGEPKLLVSTGSSQVNENQPVTPVGPSANIRVVSSPSQLRPEATTLPKLRVVSPESLGLKDSPNALLLRKIHTTGVPTPHKLKIVSTELERTRSNDYLLPSEIGTGDKQASLNLNRVFELSNRKNGALTSVTDLQTSKKLVPTEKKFKTRKVLVKTEGLMKNLANNIFLENNTLPVKRVENPTNLCEGQSIASPLWKPVSMNGITVASKNGTKDVSLSLKGKKVFQLTMKNCINEKKPDSIPSTVSLQEVNVASKSQMLKQVPSSVIFLNPYEKSKMFDRPEYGATSSPQKTKKVRLYRCATCHFSYLTLSNLQMHLATHKPKMADTGLIRDFNIEISEELLQQKQEKCIDSEKSRKIPHTVHDVFREVDSKHTSNEKGNKIPVRFKNITLPNSNVYPYKKPFISLNKIMNTEIKNQLPLNTLFLKRKRQKLRDNKRKKLKIKREMLETSIPKETSSTKTEYESLKDEQLPIKNSSKMEKIPVREKIEISSKPLKTKLVRPRSLGERYSLRLAKKSKPVTECYDDPLLKKHAVVVLSRLDMSVHGNKNTMSVDKICKEISTSLPKDTLKTKGHFTTLSKKDDNLNASLSRSAVKEKDVVIIEDDADESLKVCEINLDENKRNSRTKVEVQSKTSIRRSFAEDILKTKEHFTTLSKKDDNLNASLSRSEVKEKNVVIIEDDEDESLNVCELNSDKEKRNSRADIEVPSKKSISRSFAEATLKTKDYFTTLSKIDDNLNASCSRSTVNGKDALLIENDEVECFILNKSKKRKRVSAKSSRALLKRKNVFIEEDAVESMNVCEFNSDKKKRNTRASVEVPSKKSASSSFDENTLITKEQFRTLLLKYFTLHARLSRSAVKEKDVVIIEDDADESLKVCKMNLDENQKNSRTKVEVLSKNSVSRSFADDFLKTKEHFTTLSKIDDNLNASSSRSTINGKDALLIGNDEVERFILNNSNKGKCKWPKSSRAVVKRKDVFIEDDEVESMNVCEFNSDKKNRNIRANVKLQSKKSMSNSFVEDTLKTKEHLTTLLQKNDNLCARLPRSAVKENDVVLIEDDEDECFILHESNSGKR